MLVCHLPQNIEHQPPLVETIFTDKMKRSYKFNIYAQRSTGCGIYPALTYKSMYFIHSSIIKHLVQMQQSDYRQNI